MRYRVNCNVDDIISTITECNKKMEDSLILVNEAKNLIEDGNWSGECKDVTDSLIELCIQFHEKLIPITEDNLSTIKTFVDSADDFMSNHSVNKVWNS